MPYIQRNTIEAVQDLSLVETIGKYVQLKKSGAQFKGKSPFTTEKTGSFMVSAAKGIWKCFSTGKGGNNAVSFLMEYKNMSFPEAVETLANEHGITIDYDNSESAKKYHEAEQKKQELHPVLVSTLKRYQEEFAKLPPDHPAKKEVYEHRGYTDEIVEKYGIGYAPGKRFIYDLCVQHGRKADAMKLGLISHKGDKWWDRVIYPLWDMQRGKRVQIGLAGRSLSDNKEYSKWMNPPDTDLYKKDKYLYGLDIARNEIAKRGEVWLVEGYNDVIAWQTNQIPNTVSPCGTSITRSHIIKLSKYCNRIILCLDGDKAGLKSIKNYIPDFLKHGFRVYVKVFEGLDPDDFIREKKPTKEEMIEIATNTKLRDDGFQFYLDRIMTGDEVDDAMEAKNLCNLLSAIDDEGMRSIYLQMLAKESKTKITDLKRWLKETETEKEIPAYKNKFDIESEYQLPKEVKEPLEKILPTIKKYELFMANNRIYCQSKKEDPPYTFVCVSNFEIEVIQHMRDEEWPSKLVRIKNVHGHSAVFDMPSKDLNKPDTFETAVTNHGNYRWKGRKEHHDLLKTYLMDRMGTGRRIDVLGWQPEGFWAWNNLVIDYQGNEIQIDKNGCFMHEEVSYYIPSANSVYAFNRWMFESQKRFRSIKTNVSFMKLCEDLIKVHRKHGMMGILFSVASIFQDVVVRETKSFPLLFLYGPAGSGKDELAYACQSFLGIPQSAINLEGDASTAKANIREFAQFANGISQLSEYKPGNPKQDGILKGLWDRNGYKRGNIQSRVSSESIPIISSAIMTGNFEPTQEALITRCIYINMNKTAFSKDEDENFRKLNEIVKSGYSSFTNNFLKYRHKVDNNFMESYGKFKKEFSARLDNETNSRMIKNLSVLGTFYELFKDDIGFSFSRTEMVEHFENLITLQMSKYNSGKVITKFWDCFLHCMRGPSQDQIKVNRDFNIDGNKLYFQWTSCYNRISTRWYSMFNYESAPSKNVMADALKKDKCWVKAKSKHRFAPGEGHNTSAYVIDLNKVVIKDDLLYAVEWQEQEANIFQKPPATPENDSQTDDIKNKKEGGDSELPF